MGALHPAEQDGKAESTRASHTPRVEAVRIGHVVKPVDAVAAAPLDQLESPHRFLVAAEQVPENVLDRPAVLSAGSSDLALRQSGDQRER